MPSASGDGIEGASRTDPSAVEAARLRAEEAAGRTVQRRRRRGMRRRAGVADGAETCEGPDGFHIEEDLCASTCCTVIGGNETCADDETPCEEEGFPMTAAMVTLASTGCIVGICIFAFCIYRADRAMTAMKEANKVHAFDKRAAMGGGDDPELK